jgi:hypothetical protein
MTGSPVPRNLNRTKQKRYSPARAASLPPETVVTEIENLFFVYFLYFTDIHAKKL